MKFTTWKYKNWSGFAALTQELSNSPTLLYAEDAMEQKTHRPGHMMSTLGQKMLGLSLGSNGKRLKFSKQESNSIRFVLKSSDGPRI